MTTLTTARLKLVTFTDDHLDGLDTLNSDPEVMRYLSGRPETREYSRWSRVVRDICTLPIARTFP